MRKLLACLLVLVCFSAGARDPVPLVTNATTTGAKSCVGIDPPAAKTYQVTASTTSGTGTAVVNIEGTNNLGINRDVIATVSLTLTTTVSATANSGSFTSLDRYGQVCANITTLSGTGASVNVMMGY